MVTDDAAGVVLSAAIFYEIFGTEVTDSDEDAKELFAVIRRRHQWPRRYWVHPVNCRHKVRTMRTQRLCSRGIILRYSTALLKVRLNARSTFSSSLIS